MCELNEQLKNLAIIAQRHPPLSAERQQALTELVLLILRSGKLRPTDKSKLYEEIYEESIQNLFLYVCENIDKYNPERASLMTWVYMLWYRGFLNKALKERQIQTTRIIKFDDALESLFFLPSDSPLLSELLSEAIEADPDNLFKKEYIFSQERANFQSLMIRRLAGETWQSISLDLEINPQTLSSFYRRCINKFRGKFQEYLDS